MHKEPGHSASNARSGKPARCEGTPASGLTNVYKNGNELPTSPPKTLSSSPDFINIEGKIRSC